MDKQPLASTQQEQQETKQQKYFHSGNIHPQTLGKVQKDMQQLGDPGAPQRE